MVTSRQIAIWPPKPSSLFPQGLAHIIIEKLIISCYWVRKRWRPAMRLWVWRQKPYLLVLFLNLLLRDRTPNRWKNQVRYNFFLHWKKYVVNVYKICFHLVVFLYWFTTASLGPTLLKMKYCSFAACVCYWPIERTMLWTRFQAVFTLIRDRQWESTAISSRNTVNCVVKI